MQSACNVLSQIALRCKLASSSRPLEAGGLSQLTRGRRLAALSSCRLPQWWGVLPWWIRQEHPSLRTSVLVVLNGGPNRWEGARLANCQTYTCLSKWSNVFVWPIRFE